MARKKGGVREPVYEGLPEGLSPEVRRPARMRLVAARRLRGLTLALDGVHDPHNISAVLRSCEGFGLQNVHIVGDPRSLPLSPQIARGCHKWLSLHYHPSPAACADTLHTQGYEIWGALPDRQARPIEEIDFSRKIALVMGAERTGLSPEMRALCDGAYIIPMTGFTESLNISVAAAISVYEGASRRRAALGSVTDLTPAEAEELGERWVADDEARRIRKHIPTRQTSP